MCCPHVPETALLGSVEAFGSVRLLADRSKLSTG